MVRFQKRRRRAGRPLLFSTPRAEARRRKKATQAAARRPRALGDLEDPVRLSVRDVQRELIRAGYDVGRTGADGLWGPNTQGALQRFLERIDYQGDEPFEASRRDTTVRLETSVWSRLQSTAPRSGGEPQSRSTSTSTTTTSSTTSGPQSRSVSGQLQDEGGDAWWKSPWLWAGVALVGTGAVVFFATSGSDDEEDDELEELLPAF